MWKELGLESVKKGFDNLVKKTGVVSANVDVPSKDERGYVVSYSLKQATLNIGSNIEDGEEDISIFRIPVSDRPLTVGDVKFFFPLKSLFHCVFRFKLEDDLFDFVYLEGLGDGDLVPLFRGGISLQVLVLPSSVDIHLPGKPFNVVMDSPDKQKESIAPNREQLVREREAATAAQVKAARDFASNNALEESRKRQEKMNAQNQLGVLMDKWAFTEQGKFKDVRSLLSSMGSVLWENSGWVDVPMGELMISDAAVKKTYRKAIVLCHPDRHQKESAEKQYRADRIFNAINESYKLFT